MSVDYLDWRNLFLLHQLGKVPGAHVADFQCVHKGVASLFYVAYLVSMAY